MDCRSWSIGACVVFKILPPRVVKWSAQTRPAAGTRPARPPESITPAELCVKVEIFFSSRILHGTAVVRRRLVLFWTRKKKKLKATFRLQWGGGESADTKGGRVGGAHYRQKVVLFVQEIKTARQERGPFSLRRTFFLLMEIYFYGRP